MTIYEHRTSLATTSGDTTTVTLNIRGGLIRQLLVRANTATTVFRANLSDASSLTRRNWGFSTGELDQEMSMPVSGRVTLNVTNASPATETFNVYIGVEE